MKQWLNEIKTQSNPDVKVFLIGNKIDQDEKRRVTKEMADKFVEENNLDFAMETSAKTGFNAKNVFLEAAKCLYIEHLKYKDRQSRPQSNAGLTPQGTKIPQPNSLLSKDKVITKENKKTCC